MVKGFLITFNLRTDSTGHESQVFSSLARDNIIGGRDNPDNDEIFISLLRCNFRSMRLRDRESKLLALLKIDLFEYRNPRDERLTFLLRRCP